MKELNPLNWRKTNSCHWTTSFCSQTIWLCIFSYWDEDILRLLWAELDVLQVKTFSWDINEMERKCSFCQALAYCWSGKASKVSMRFWISLHTTSWLTYYSVSYVRQSAIGQFLNFYHFFFLFLFGEKYSAELVTTSLIRNNVESEQWLAL